MRRLVLLAAALLPGAMRDRYREQWLADLRDAPEAGIPRAQIAWGALAFAMTAPRPWPTFGSSIDHRRAARLAFVLAFASALLGLTWYPGYSVDSVPAAPLGIVLFVIDVIVLFVEVLGPIAAIVLVSISRDVRPRERVAVWLLVVAATAPLLSNVIGRGDHVYLYPGALVYVGAVALIVAALALRHRKVDLRAVRLRPGRAAFAAVAVAVLGATAVASAVFAWAGRTPLITNWPAGSYYYEEWLRLKLDFELTVDVLFVMSAITVGLISLGVVLTGVLRVPVRLGSATTGAVLLIAFGYAQVSWFLALGTPTAHALVAPTMLMSVARLALIVAVIVSVGGAPVRTPTLKPDASTT